MKTLSLLGILFFAEVLFCHTSPTAVDVDDGWGRVSSSVFGRDEHAQSRFSPDGKPGDAEKNKGRELLFIDVNGNGEEIGIGKKTPPRSQFTNTCCWY